MPSGGGGPTAGSTVYVWCCSDQRNTTSSTSPHRPSRLRIPWPTNVETDLAALTWSRATSPLTSSEPTSPNPKPSRSRTYRAGWAPTMAGEFDAGSNRSPVPLTGPSSVFADRAPPYWEFRGERPSVALIAADRGPSCYVATTMVPRGFRFFGWFGDDVWCSEDSHAASNNEATRRSSLSGKDLGATLGLSPHVRYPLSQQLTGHCYKSCTRSCHAG